MKDRSRERVCVWECVCVHVPLHQRNTCPGHFVLKNLKCLESCYFIFWEKFSVSETVFCFFIELRCKKRLKRHILYYRLNGKKTKQKKKNLSSFIAINLTSCLYDIKDWWEKDSFMLSMTSFDVGFENALWRRIDAKKWSGSTSQAIAAFIVIIF